MLLYFASANGWPTAWQHSNVQVLDVGMVEYKWVLEYSQVNHWALNARLVSINTHTHTRRSFLSSTWAVLYIICISLPIQQLKQNQQLCEYKVLDSALRHTHNCKHVRFPYGYVQATYMCTMTYSSCAASAASLIHKSHLCTCGG